MRFVINITSISAGGALYDQSDKLDIEMPQRSIPIWLDSGSPLIVDTLHYCRSNGLDSILMRPGTLPDSLVDKLHTYAGAYMRPNIEAPLIPCEQSKNKSAISFGLGGTGGPKISVPIGELVTPVLYANGSKLATEGRQICQFGIWYLPQDIYNLTVHTYVVGDAFLRSAYVVSNNISRKSL